MSKKLRHQFWAVPKYIAADTELSPTAKLVYGVLNTRENGENLSWPSQRSIADSLGMKERRVRMCVAELVKLGFVQAEKRGLGKTNTYSIVHSRGDRQETTGLERQDSTPTERQDTAYTLLKNNEKNILRPTLRRVDEKFSSLNDLVGSDKPYLRVIGRWYKQTKTESKDIADFNRRIKQQAGPAAQLVKLYTPKEIYSVLDELVAWWEKNGSKQTAKPTLFSVLKILRK